MNNNTVLSTQEKPIEHEVLEKSDFSFKDLENTISRAIKESDMDEAERKTFFDQLGRICAAEDTSLKEYRLKDLLNEIQGTQRLRAEAFKLAGKLEEVSKEIPKDSVTEMKLAELDVVNNDVADKETLEKYIKKAKTALPKGEIAVKNAEQTMKMYEERHQHIQLKINELQNLNIVFCRLSQGNEGLCNNKQFFEDMNWEEKAWYVDTYLPELVIDEFRCLIEKNGHFYHDQEKSLTDVKKMKFKDRIDHIVSLLKTKKERKEKIKVAKENINVLMGRKKPDEAHIFALSLKNDPEFPRELWKKELGAFAEGLNMNLSQINTRKEMVEEFRNAGNLDLLIRVLFNLKDLVSDEEIDRLYNEAVEKKRAELERDTKYDMWYRQAQESYEEQDFEAANMWCEKLISHKSTLAKKNRSDLEQSARILLKKIGVCTQEAGKMQKEAKIQEEIFKATGKIPTVTNQGIESAYQKSDAVMKHIHHEGLLEKAKHLWKGLNVFSRSTKNAERKKLLEKQYKDVA